ncbi:MAG: potassium channel family protein [Anaerolineae bacterium]
MRIIILGCGRTGAYLARNLVAQGHEVAVIDRNAASFRRLGESFAGELVSGIGIDEDVLRRAGTDRAQAFIAVTNGDNTNVMAAQTARELFGVPKAICRIYDPLRAEIYRSLGLEVICPTVLGAANIEQLLSA